MSHAASEWMPWFGEEFWGSVHVAEMSNDEALLYQWLIWQNWKAGSIPGQIESLRRMIPGRFAACLETAWPVVAARFEVGTDGRLRNARVAEDLCAAADRVAKCAVAGRASAASRRAKLASVASQQPKHVEPELNGRSTDVQRTLNTERMGADGSGEERKPEETTQIPPAAGAGKPRSPKKPKKVEPVDEDLAVPGYAETVACYFEVFEAAAGEKPSFGKLEGRKIKELLAKAETGDGRGVARACAVLRYAHGDHWRTTRGRVTLQGIVSDFNGLLVGAKNAWKADLSKGQLAFVQGQLAPQSSEPSEDPYEKMLRDKLARAPKELPA